MNVFITMILYGVLVIISSTIIRITNADDVLGCGGFLKTHVQIDYAKVEVILYTKQGSLKDKTNCAPNNGYYFLPLYDKGEYTLKINPPPGWSFTPTEVDLVIDGKTDLCSKGVDINFTFKGFGITGKVENVHGDGPSGIDVSLSNGSEERKTVTSVGGSFFFTPVFPGNYTLKITHPRWRLQKSSVVVTVTEGNTELPPKSLVILGYDVSGLVKSDIEPMSDVYLILFPKSDGDYNKLTAIDCHRADIIGFKSQSKPLCHVKSNQNGVYTFPSLSSGNYKIIPFYKGENIHFEPSFIEFTIENDSKNIETVFEVKGITISGRVLNGPNGQTVSGAVVYINGAFSGATTEKGDFKLEQVKGGQYLIKIEADDLLFEETLVKINPTVASLEDFVASGYKVCGVVVSEKSQQVLFTNIASQEVIKVHTQPGNGKFCQILKCGKYEIQVSVDETNKIEGVQFFPISHVIDVNNPIYGLTFSQLKAVVKGKVKCLREQDCISLKVQLISAMGSVNSELSTPINADGQYSFSDIRPGIIAIHLSSNILCWKESSHQVLVNSTTAIVPDFVQTGYLLTISSSHDAILVHKPVNESSKNSFEWNIQPGISHHCLVRHEEYRFEIRGCHLYESNEITYSTDAEDNLITLTAMKHLVMVEIDSEEVDSDIYILVGNVVEEENSLFEQSEKQKMDVKGTQNGYVLELYMSETDVVSLEPKSETLWIIPDKLTVQGVPDCKKWPVKFTAVKGRLISGRITPPIQGVSITVKAEGLPLLLEMETDENGFYKFLPLDNQINYIVTAKRDSYVLSGPDNKGNFVAHKLAEVVVEINDKNTKEPLQGALLSLSGGDSYRSNLQTNADGKIGFHSLSPGDYFLRPMMKEYSFEPTSQLINVKEGATVVVKMMGKRVAFSATGVVTSLNGEPENELMVVARGVGNCSQLVEEATTEGNGLFRIRGLQPFCSYIFSVRDSTNNIIMHSVPEQFTINSVQGDLSDIKLIVLHPIQNTDIAVHVYAENQDHYKSIRVKLLKDGPTNQIVQSMKLDSYKLDGIHNPGLIVYFATVPLDGKMYTIQAETVNNQQTSGIFKNNNYVVLANESFQSVYLKFVPQIDPKEQHIKQTSVWALLLIFILIIVFYNIEQVAQIVRNYVGKISASLPIAHFPKQSPQTEHIYTDDLDQIVQNINAPKRKVKPRKA